MEVRRYALTIRETAEALGVSEWLIREECKRGRLIHKYMGNRIVIPVWAVEEYVGVPLSKRTEAQEVVVDSSPARSPGSLSL